jgi:signal transduction histidine kinase
MPNPERPTLLVVDDMPQNVEVIAEYLSEAYDSQCAFSGEEALALLAQEDLPLPDLIMLDVMMPGMDGYAVCRSLKKNARTRSIPVIFVTAKQDIESEVAALAVGGVDFIHKPIVPETLRARVGVHLALRCREMELERLNEQLAVATASKSFFLASMSHEIRTPMNAILGFAKLLEDEPITEDQRQMAHHINRAGRSLLGIINDILDFSKIEAGQISVEQRPFHLSELLTHIDNLMGSVAQGKGLTLRLEAREETAVAGRLSGDVLRIEQVLINLVGNAIKFTPQGGVTLRVTPVSITESCARLRFDIEDTGIGLGPEAVAKLFSPFTQADSGIARRFGGTGLGLAISKCLVELMGGTIGVDSTLGIGSTFWFELPFERLADEEQPASIAAEVKGPRLRGLRLLVVDDSSINLKLAERVLQREGAKVTLMKDGQLALDGLRAHPEAFDLVLMDIQMPVMDGLTATRAIREELGLDTLPVIALTAGVLAEEKQNALDAGVNDFLPKPMDLDLMAAMIRRYCPESGRAP